MTTNAVQKVDLAPPALKGLIESPDAIEQILDNPMIQQSILSILPKHINSDRFRANAIYAVQQNPALLQCTKLSFVVSLMKAATLGLMTNTPLQHAALIPYKGEVTFQIMYRGYCQLLWNTDLFGQINTRIVFECDEFDYDLGSEPKIHHKPRLDGTADDYKPNKIVCAYSVLGFIDPAKPKHLEVMRRDEIERAKNTSQANSKPAWDNWYGEMGRKTVLKRAIKMLPMSTDKAIPLERADEFEYADQHRLVESPDGKLALSATRQTASSKLADELRQEDEVPPRSASTNNDSGETTGQILKEVTALETKANLGNKTIEARTEHAGLADLSKATREGLLNYRSYLNEQLAGGDGKGDDSSDKADSAGEAPPKNGKADF